MVLDAVVPLVSASQKPSKAINVTPVKKELKLGARPVRVNQFPFRVEAPTGLEPLINTFMQYRLLQECRSKFNTSIEALFRRMYTSTGFKSDKSNNHGHTPHRTKPLYPATFST